MPREEGNDISEEPLRTTQADEIPAPQDSIVRHVLASPKAVPSTPWDWNVYLELLTD